MGRKQAKMTTQLQIQTLGHSNMPTIRGSVMERKSEWKEKIVVKIALFCKFYKYI